ncbi:hypothetical protein HRbin20_01167 [bacterium HR20]|nr:hypothetical protein HRbin20_01167 [bacterium HR20]
MLFSIEVVGQLHKRFRLGIEQVEVGLLRAHRGHGNVAPLG